MLAVGNLDSVERVEDADFDDLFCEKMMGFANEASQFSEQGVYSLGSKIAVITGVDALITKLQRVKSELIAYESPLNGLAGSLAAGHHSGDESNETRSA